MIELGFCCFFFVGPKVFNFEQTNRYNIYIFIKNTLKCYEYKAVYVV